MREGLPPAVAEALSRLPDAPGCYRYLDAEGKVLYVGKALSLRSRVRSYFQPSAQHPPRIAALVDEVRAIDIILAGSEVEALILESNLIKEHRPRFNVLLTDDKSFPYLKLTTQDAFPRVTLVRQPRQDGSLYYGPFLPASHAHRTLRMIPRFFQVANCHLPFDGKQRPCLYYHLDQCLAPCAGKADPATYAERVGEAQLFLEGRDDDLRRLLHARMKAHSDALEFEQAARSRDMIDTLDALAQRKTMISVGLEACDFWAEYRDGDQAAVELFRMREGKMIGRREFTLNPAPPPETFYDEILPQFYAAEDPPPELVLPRRPQKAELLEEFLSARRGAKVAVASPSHGPRRQFLDLVAHNAQLAFEARFRQAHDFGVQALDGLRDVLGLTEAPFRIEGFDVSHLRGDEPRASLVVFEGGKPKKSDYRIFKPRTAAAGDDYQALREVVARRYARVVREGKRLPDLVLIDGGKGQLAAALAALETEGLTQLPVMSLAKREEEIFLEGRGEPILLDRHTPALRLVQQIRDEAHRFALRRHREARDKGFRQSLLTVIPGIGPTTAKRLLTQFGSLDGVKRATEAALAAAVGPAKARLLRSALAQTVED